MFEAQFHTEVSTHQWFSVTFHPIERTDEAFLNEFKRKLAAGLVRGIDTVVDIRSYMPYQLILNVDCSKTNPVYVLEHLIELTDKVLNHPNKEFYISVILVSKSETDSQWMYVLGDEEIDRQFQDSLIMTIGEMPIGRN